MVRRLPAACAVLLAAPILFAALHLFAQAPAASPRRLPSDPEEFLEQARSYNSLDAAGLAPWELKATFQLFDERGGVPQTFSFDEIWPAPNLYRETWTSASFQQTTVVNQDGTFRSGGQR